MVAIDPSDNGGPDIRREIKKIAAKSHWFGCWRIGLRPERQCMLMNHKKLYRLYMRKGLG